MSCWVWFGVGYLLITILRGVGENSIGILGLGGLGAIGRAMRAAFDVPIGLGFFGRFHCGFAMHVKAEIFAPFLGRALRAKENMQKMDALWIGFDIKIKSEHV